MLPRDGYIFQYLRSYDKEFDKNLDKNENPENIGGLESGPDTNNATRLFLDDKDKLISEAYACINPLQQNETAENKIVRVINNEIGIVENSLPIPTLGNRINDYSYLSI